MTILGIHHITLGCSDAQRTIDFYTQVLGQRFIKKTVNFDDPGTYHLYFGNQTGAPGSAITFFEWPGAQAGQPGIGGTHHFALRVADYDGLLQWKRRLLDLGIKVSGPFDRYYFVSIYFRDPDGTILEIATDGPGFTRDEAADALGREQRQPPAEMLIDNRDEEKISAAVWPEAVPVITAKMALMQGMHHVSAISSDIQRSDAFFADLLGLRRVKMTSNFDNPGSAHWYWGVGNGEPGSLITYFEHDPLKSKYARMGAGQTHHYAFRVATEDEQLAWREKLVSAGLNVSPVMDRMYFKSIYTKDPDGHIVEIATDTPGFTADEDVSELGTNLRLPPWYEQHREEIERILRPVEINPWEAPK